MFEISVRNVELFLSAESDQPVAIVTADHVLRSLVFAMKVGSFVSHCRDSAVEVANNSELLSFRGLAVFFDVFIKALFLPIASCLCRCIPAQYFQTYAHQVHLCYYQSR